LHSHPYDEVIIVLEGEATFDDGVAKHTARAGDVVVIPAGQAHGFVNSSSEQLRQIDIHASSHFATKWLAPEEDAKPAGARTPRGADSARAGAEPTVTIIGSGDMAVGIGTRLLAGGAGVQIVGRTGEKAAAVAAGLAASGVAAATVTSATLGDPIQGEVVVLAVPYSAAGDVVEDYGEQLAGKIVVDITNPVDWDSRDGLVIPEASSGANEIAKRAHPQATIVKAFNTTFARTLVDGRVAGQTLDVLIAGDDEQAKNEVARLVESGGLRAVDVGPLRRARQLEELGFLHINLQEAMGTGFASAVKLVA
jgi:NADPH-dependent F420 reductase